MRASAWMHLGATAALGLASCAALENEFNRPTPAERGEQRWGEVRAGLKCQLAEEQYSQGKAREARELAEEAVGLDPKSSRAYLLMTKILLERGETAAAAEALNKAVEHGGDTAETDYFSGVIAERYGRFADALAWYEHAANKDPVNAHYVAAVAEALVALDRAAEALDLVEQRRTDFEQNATLPALAGGIYVMLGRYEKAADAYRDALQISPDDATLKRQLGMALASAGKYREAADVLGETSGGESTPTSALVALGRSYLALGRPDEARAVLRRALEEEPDHARGLALLTQAACACGDLLTARRSAARAVRLEPDNAEYAMLLGYVCFRQKDYANAVASLEHAQQRGPADTITLYLLSQSHQALGDMTAARKCGHRALQLDPRCKWARELIEDRSVSMRPEVDGPGPAERR